MGRMCRFMPSMNKRALDIMDIVCQHPCAKPFIYPIEPKFRKFIHEDMNLSMIREKILLYRYTTLAEWRRDMLQILQNTDTIYTTHSYQHLLAAQMVKIFEKEFEKINSYSISRWSKAYNKILLKLQMDYEKMPNFLKTQSILAGTLQQCEPIILPTNCHHMKKTVHQNLNKTLANNTNISNNFPNNLSFECIGSNLDDSSNSNTFNDFNFNNLNFSEFKWEDEISSDANAHSNTNSTEINLANENYSDDCKNHSILFSKHSNSNNEGLPVLFSPIEPIFSTLQKSSINYESNNESEDDEQIDNFMQFESFYYDSKMNELKLRFEQNVNHDDSLVHKNQKNKKIKNESIKNQIIDISNESLYDNEEIIENTSPEFSQAVSPCNNNQITVSVGGKHPRQIQSYTSKTPQLNSTQTNSTSGQSTDSSRSFSASASSNVPQKIRLTISTHKKNHLQSHSRNETRNPKKLKMNYNDKIKRTKTKRKEEKATKNANKYNHNSYPSSPNEIEEEDSNDIIINDRTIGAFMMAATLLMDINDVYHMASIIHKYEPDIDLSSVRPEIDVQKLKSETLKELIRYTRNAR